jgi:hypothetical protein
MVLKTFLCLESKADSFWRLLSMERNVNVVCRLIERNIELLERKAYGGVWSGVVRGGGYHPKKL